MKVHRRLHLICVFLLAPVCFVAAAYGESRPQTTAGQIRDATGVRAGLIVHLGCGGGRLTAALHQSDACRVHGLDADAGDVQQARNFIRARGL
ncbi:MAG: class I SAM-dependent methyltransferase, partial [Planctomycetota bacterium]